MMEFPLVRTRVPPRTGVPHDQVWVPPPPHKGPETSHWGTPQKGHGTSGSIMGWRWGKPPPPRCGLTNKLKLLPSSSLGYRR